MIKALKEIGFQKAMRFVYLTIINAIFNHCLFPFFRVFILRLFGANIGKNCVMHNVQFYNYYHNGFSSLKIADNCFLGNEVMIDLAGKVILSNHVTLSNRSFILTHTNVGFKEHPLQKYIKKNTKTTVFDNGCFIGVGSIIMPGVKIGKESVVGAGSVVTVDVPPRSVVAGSPAKIIKKLK
ncbi:hypothetical protein A3C23_00785 [Candidatus Roizmanbacteria bacterium RIFCSPHIGHO2_02_FULL_37_13b]|uniref:Acetyltransferase n=1 Tax=Candidatus Roizmanbacteria bacterium RIFCSPLOWO2_02_FULL_36_11 TaxID=1802071 RepID=A0A1F7JD38_9BACT|nr:MAG: hypothetical protein A3C23_00785 [Candidatus Roizmanbacteria bacterium RIFCSPHIGHO2_02_FULL_37_13b]OGK53533.1 MAG: hypothetical protein A3H78_04895 [Candidatus Roizmanbacteria bacterium RIFCSPLOWO2_02_FULL_36_11]